MHKIGIKFPRQFYWMGAKFATLHRKQFYWNGERTILRSYIQQWHKHLEGFQDKEALIVLQQYVPPTYKHIIQSSSTLIDCLQHLARYCPNEEMQYDMTKDETRKRKSPEKKGNKESAPKDGRIPD